MLAALNVTEIVAWILGAAGLLAALAGIWKFLGFMSALVTFVQIHTPILTTIAQQFEKNGGRSLKDQIDRIEEKADQAKKVAEDAGKEAREARTLVVETNTNMRQLMRMFTPKIVPAVVVPESTE